jgi:hypothetical protein
MIISRECLKHRVIESNGIKMHLAEQGDGLLVLLCHGFPELWYSWPPIAFGSLKLRCSPEFTVLNMHGDNPWKTHSLIAA